MKYAELAQAYAALGRGIEYLKAERIVGIAVNTKHPNGGSFVIVNPNCSNIDCNAVDVVNKEYGSDITGLYSAYEMLGHILDNHLKANMDRRNAK